MPPNISKRESYNPTLPKMLNRSPILYLPILYKVKKSFVIKIVYPTIKHYADGNILSKILGRTGCVSLAEPLAMAVYIN